MTTLSPSGYVLRLRQFIHQAMSPGSSPSGGPTFEALALELFQLQWERNRVFRAHCQARGATPDQVTDWTRIPPLPVQAFKEFDVTCLSLAERTTAFHSSGTTTHVPSRHHHSVESLALYEASLWPWFRIHLLPEPGLDLNLILLTPSPAEAPHSSLAHMFEVIRRELDQPAEAFVGRVDAEAGWTLDWMRTMDALDRAAAGSRPVLVLGTAFGLVHLIDRLGGEGRRCLLPAGSRVMETGGYKGRSRELPRAELHRLIRQQLGIAPACVRCEYGMSELSSQAYDGIASVKTPGEETPRTFRFPPWARARIVSPETGTEVGIGGTGLIQVIDLANAFSVMAVQTEDLGLRREGGFELLGRAGMAEPRGCSRQSV